MMDKDALGGQTWLPLPSWHGPVTFSVKRWWAAGDSWGIWGHGSLKEEVQISSGVRAFSLQPPRPQEPQS